MPCRKRLAFLLPRFPGALDSSYLPASHCSVPTAAFADTRGVAIWVSFPVGMSGRLGGFSHASGFHASGNVELRVLDLFSRIHRSKFCYSQRNFVSVVQFPSSFVIFEYRIVASVISLRFDYKAAMRTAVDFSGNHEWNLTSQTSAKRHSSSSSMESAVFAITPSIF